VTSPENGLVPGAGGTGTLLVRGGHVLTMDPGTGDIPGGDVLVSGRAIAAVGAGLAALAPAGARVIDATGMIVAPGLVDTHWHMWNTLLRGMSETGPGYFRLCLIVVSPAGPNLGMLTDPVQLLVTAAQPGNVDTVIADGRVLKQGGALTTLDAERVGADARQALAGVIARSRSATR